MEKKNRLFLLFSFLLHRSGLSPSLPSSFFSSPSSPPRRGTEKRGREREERGLQIFASPALPPPSFGYFCPSPSGQFGKQLCFCCICQKEFVDISLDCTKRKKNAFHSCLVGFSYSSVQSLSFMLVVAGESPRPLPPPPPQFFCLWGGEEKQCQTHIVPRRWFAQSKAQQRRLGSSLLKTDRLKFLSACMGVGGVFFKLIL